ncbi:transcription termination factor Rho [Anaerocolumna cellulosilytica]|uniref:Transcription termination factor Rho n=1 Tax=Anaerocolumna cellulosilytica TaxID=433286 RepID=A0A6S6R2V2_9FIRM|nr:transcription termination factor Rho [Anaerocolumna cellulosilytica]MBB5197721.1 transcription termination factor Rho [Anaerocolumna cellulosilytica]BCJ96476.1 transcription termination factor Rho [Anaerocolumna cellulosilytica]
MEAQYSEMSLTELRTLAKNRGIKGITALRKQELIDALIRYEPTDGKTEVDSRNADRDEEQNPGAEISKMDETKSKTENTKNKMDEVKASSYKSRKTDTESKKSWSAPQENEKKINFNHAESDAKRNGGNALNDTDFKRTGMNQSDTEYRKNVGNSTDTENKRPYSQPDSETRKPIGYGQEPDYRKMTTNTSDGDVRRNSVASSETEQLDSGETKEGILEVMPDGYGFIRCDNYLPGENDVYVSPAQIRRFGLKTGDIVVGNTRIRNQGEKFSALLYVKSVNGFHPSEAQRRKKFEDLTPVFPNERIHLETVGSNVSMRMVDLISPIGKGQRGMIVSPPKTGKTTLVKQIAKAITKNHPDFNLIILLIDERPEEVTDIKEFIEGKNVEVIYSTFDELPENHKRVSEMVIERAKRLVEHKKDVVILLDSITRLARAYNLTVQASGRTLSGGLDPAALHMPKRFFGAARNMREGGSLTILATALVDTGSRMDDVVFEEFKGTGNMELVLDRNLSEKRIFPALDLTKSSTRRDDLLLNQSEMEATYLMRKAFNSMKSDDAVERIIDMFLKTKTNAEFIDTIKKTKIVF